MIELLTKIKDYVDEVIQMNFDQYRFNPLNRTESFKAWGERYLAGYTGDDKIKYSAMKELLTQLDNYNEFLQIDQSNLLLNRCKWITPNTQNVPESGSIPVMAAVQHLVVEGEGVTPTIPNVIPIDAGFNLASDLMPGSIGFNITDDIWYYNDGTNIKKLVDFTQVTTSQIEGLDTSISTINGRLDALEAALNIILEAIGVIQESIGTVQESIGTIEQSIEEIPARYEPDNITIVLDVQNKLKIAAMPSENLLLSQYLVGLSEAENTKLINIESSIAWDCERTGSEFISLSPMVGNGNAVLTLNCNLVSGSTISSVFTFSAVGAADVVLNVTWSPDTQ